MSAHPPLTPHAELRRREATKSFLRYFAVFFFVALTLSLCTAYAVVDSMRQRADSRAVRIEYCRELEKLKTQNREAVRDDQKHYKRNLRLLGIKDTPELRRAAEESWAKRLARNAPKACPYEA